MFKYFFALLATGLFSMAAPAAQPPEYPTRPIRIITPWPAGGNVDFIARVLAQKLTANLGQAVMVENPTGASGTIGVNQVARAAPDGYTLLVNAVTQVIVPSLIPKIPYDPIADFVPIGQVSSVPFVFVANPSEPFNTVGEFVKWAKAQPHGVAYGSAGVGSTNHLAPALFGSLTGLDLRHIPYKGSALAQLDVYNGQIPIMFDATTGIAGAIQSGKVKAIAIAADKRSSLFPNVPTFSEAGFAGMNFSTWHGLYAPAGTPASVVNRLSLALATITQDPDFIKRLQASGAEVVFSKPDEFLAYNKSELNRWAEIVKRTGAAQAD
jgi:tripartite-type tricarboxylate transporter receptor subunit TctC